MPWPFIVLFRPICLLAKVATESGLGAAKIFANLGEPTIGADPDFFSFAAHEVYAFIPVAP